MNALGGKRHFLMTNQASSHLHIFTYQLTDFASAKSSGNCADIQAVEIISSSQPAGYVMSRPALIRMVTEASLSDYHSTTPYGNKTEDWKIGEFISHRISKSFYIFHKASVLLGQRKNMKT